jgi:hypothetical protein
MSWASLSGRYACRCSASHPGGSAGRGTRTVQDTRASSGYLGGARQRRASRSRVEWLVCGQPCGRLAMVDCAVQRSAMAYGRRAAATSPDHTMGFVHAKSGSLCERGCDKSSLQNGGIDRCNCPPGERGEGATPPGGGGGRGRYRYIYRRVQVLKAARGWDAGDGEGWTRVASAEQTCDAWSIARRDRP